MKEDNQWRDIKMESSAEISPCGTYRYQLDRWAVVAGRPFGPKVAWIMVNPSTADALSDDATIRKIKGFSERMGCNRFTVGNLFAYRATDIKALKTANAPIGPLNDEYLDRIIQDADRVMVAWGPTAKLPKNLRNRWRAFKLMADEYGIKLYCLGTAKDGQPLHPLMQPYSAEIVEWQGI